MKRERQDWRNTQPGLWQLYTDHGSAVIAEVYRTECDVFTGWGWSVWGYRGFGIYSDARDAKIRCGELVLERQREPEPPTPVEQWNALFD